MNRYSQHKEDLALIDFIKTVEARDGVTIPRLVIEAGALDGTTNSNSRLFIEQGWKAILIEPNPDKKAELNRLHGDNRNVDLVFKAVSDYPEKATTNLYIHPKTAGHSSLIPIDGADSVAVETDRLISIVTNSRLFTGDIGILSLDIEGLEVRIIPDILLLQPCIVIIEANCADAREQQREMMRPHYIEIACNSVNSIYYRRDMIDGRKKYTLTWK